MLQLAGYPQLSFVGVSIMTILLIAADVFILSTAFLNPIDGRALFIFGTMIWFCTIFLRRSLLASESGYIPQYQPNPAHSNFVRESKLHSSEAKVQDRHTSLEAAVCGVCSEGFESIRKVAFCAECETPHHMECWRYFGRCATYACGHRAKNVFRELKASGK